MAKIYIGIGIGVAILQVVRAGVVYHFLCRRKDPQEHPTQNPPTTAPIAPTAAPVDSVPAASEPKSNSYYGDPVFCFIINSEDLNIYI